MSWGVVSSPPASETPGSSPRQSPVARRRRAPAWAHWAVFTPVTREGEVEGERGSRAKPQQSPSKAPNFSAAPGRERRAGQKPGRQAGCERPGPQGRVRTSGSEGPSAPGAASVPTPVAEEGRAQAPSPQARSASSVPAVAGSPAGRHSRPAKAQPPGRSGPGALSLLLQLGAGGTAAALTWLVPGGRDGHGSGARGGTGSPGKDRLFRRGAGQRGKQAGHSPVSETAPWTPTRSFSTAAGPPCHYPPPSSVAAASTSSSAETPRPLHTLSHHAAGEPLPLNVTSGRRWLGRGRALVGAGGWGEDTSGELVSQNATPAQALSPGVPVAILSKGKLPFSFGGGIEGDVLRLSASG